jgi:mono/diheme cytochrome c family protein
MTQVSAKRNFILCLGFLTIGFSYNVLRAQTAATSSASLYTADQAKRGGIEYQKQCAMCHGRDLAGIDQSPALTGDDFLSKYQGQSISVLFDKIHKTMPAISPGSLSPAQTADILSFILSSNKYLAGTTALPSDENSLKKLQIQKP